ncbi:transposase [Streptomyces sp. NBC_01005]|uniref:Tn3 family transposase n=1 Tax=unclassified Streptomyces TaxID=2593676 RepID=UPI00386E9767|nr:transposase [Streptomyces sp. NBC_01005]WTC92644.1 transposase [Streptomyces sp. NBC_01650]
MDTELLSDLRDRLPRLDHDAYSTLTELGVVRPLVGSHEPQLPLQSRTPRYEGRDINDGLQVVENWNSANHDLFYGKDGDLTGSDKESQEVSMLALHLLQSALVHVNTLLLQDILSEEKWQKRLTDADRRALSPLFWTHVNPYGRFELDMNNRLDLALGVALPRPLTVPEAETPEPTAERTAGTAS